MRVTQSMLAQNSLRHLSKSYELLGKYQDQMLTRKNHPPVPRSRCSNERIVLSD